MIPRGARGSLVVGCVALGLFGVASFVAPSWAAERFPWKVGPFLAQTIGGWAIGSAAFAALAARHRSVRNAYPLLVFLAVFGVGELVVAAVFLDKLVTGSPLTWPYLVGLVAIAVGALWTGLDQLRHRGDARVPAGGPLAPRWMRMGAVAFAAFVGLLALGTLLAGPSGAVAQGRFFPEPMTPFSIRAFSAFFLAICASVVSVIPERRLAPLVELSLAGSCLLLPITIAAFLNLGRFDLTGQPGGTLYLGAYIGSLALFGWVAWRYRKLLEVTPGASALPARGP